MIKLLIKHSFFHQQAAVSVSNKNKYKPITFCFLVYILPPLINFYGQRFAVAQLIKWGYASLVSTGAPPPPNINVAPLVTPVPGLTENFVLNFILF
jgi:hypothetical protein